MDCGQQSAMGNLSNAMQNPGMESIKSYAPTMAPQMPMGPMGTNVSELEFLAHQQHMPMNGMQMANEFNNQMQQERIRQQVNLQTGPQMQRQRPMMQPMMPMMQPMMMHPPMGMFGPMMQQPMPMTQPQQTAEVAPVTEEPQEAAAQPEVLEDDLSGLRVTDNDKDKIRRILENQDEEWQQSNFVGLLRELEQKPSAPEQAQAPAPPTDAEEALGNQWANEFSGPMSANNFIEQLRHEDPTWANEMERIQQDTGIDWSRDLGLNWQSYMQNMMGAEAPQVQGPKEDEYGFEDSNTYLEHADPFEEGIRLMNEGNLSEAVKAFEAACQLDATRAEAWRYLGICNAHNENERNAIAAYLNCIEHDPYDLQALLELGISYTNDLNPNGALNYLQNWLINHPDYSHVQSSLPPYEQPPRGFYEEQKRLQDKVINLFIQCNNINPEDCDVHIVLGVLYNLTCEYEKGVFHFKHAVRLRPEDATLWNKLGATQANGENSEEAIESYNQALQLKPNYTRALSNLGIGFSNLFLHDEACQAYLACLSFNPEADNTWDHLQQGLAEANRPELAPLCAQRNIELFRPHFDF